MGLGIYQELDFLCQIQPKKTDALISPGNSDKPLLPVLEFCDAKRGH